MTPGKNYPSLIMKSEDEENYFLPTLRELKPIMKDSKLILMGGVRNPIAAEEILKNNEADFIAISRPLICEPDLPKKWKAGDLTPPLCNNCNSCYMSVLSGPVKCTTKKKLLRKRQKEEI